MSGGNFTNANMEEANYKGAKVTLARMQGVKMRATIDHQGKRQNSAPGAKSDKPWWKFW